MNHVKWRASEVLEGALLVLRLEAGRNAELFFVVNEQWFGGGWAFQKCSQ